MLSMNDFVRRGRLSVQNASQTSSVRCASSDVRHVPSLGDLSKFVISILCVPAPFFTVYIYVISFQV